MSRVRSTRCTCCCNALLWHSSLQIMWTARLPCQAPECKFQQHCKLVSAACTSWKLVNAGKYHSSLGRHSGTARPKEQGGSGAGVECSDTNTLWQQLRLMPSKASSRLPCSGRCACPAAQASPSLECQIWRLKGVASCKGFSSGSRHCCRPLSSISLRVPVYCSCTVPAASGHVRSNFKCSCDLQLAAMSSLQRCHRAACASLASPCQCDCHCRCRRCHHCYQIACSLNACACTYLCAGRGT